MPYFKKKFQEKFITGMVFELQTRRKKSFLTKILIKEGIQESAGTLNA